MKKTARRNIPRGCQTAYIPGFSEEIKSLYNKYLKLYKQNPFSQETITCGNTLLTELSKRRLLSWKETLENTDMKHSSRKAWSMIKKLSTDPKVSKDMTNVTANQIARQLLLNGKPEHKIKVKTSYNTKDLSYHISKNHFYIRLEACSKFSQIQEIGRARLYI